MISIQEIEQLIAAGVPDASVRVINEYGDGEHFEAEVASPAFVGLSRIQQHRMVYQALGEAMGGRIHALALKTYPPDRWPHAGQE